MNTMTTTTTTSITSRSTLARLALCTALAELIAPSLARAQAPLPKSEAEELVPPQGSAVDVPVHIGAVCILSFPEKMSPDAISSSADFEVQPWGPGGIAVRAVNDKAAPSTVALATASGQIKVNVTLRVVPDTQPALTLVRFKAVTAMEAFDARVKAGIAKGLAPFEKHLEMVRKDLEKQKKELDALIALEADHDNAERLLRRADVVKLDAHERNNDHVILHVQRGVLVGEDGFLVFEIQNRSKQPYHVASVRVIFDGRNVAGDTHLVSTATTRDPALLGVVAPGATARGIVMIRPVQRVLRRSLALEITTPNKRGAIRVERGIVLR
jgi:hypothetical protein